MATALQIESVSFEDYIAGERDIEIRSEYVDGQVYAMAGASEAIVTRGFYDASTAKPSTAYAH